MVPLQGLRLLTVQQVNGVKGGRVWKTYLVSNYLYVIIILLRHVYELGYHEEGNSFGTIKKGKYKAASDFRFDYVAEVIAM